MEIFQYKPYKREGQDLNFIKERAEINVNREGNLLNFCSK